MSRIKFRANIKKHFVNHYHNNGNLSPFREKGQYLNTFADK